MRELHREWFRAMDQLTPHLYGPDIAALAAWPPKESENRFRALGIPEDPEIEDRLGLERIEADGNRRYQPIESGSWALVTPVIDGPNVVDLVAWPTREPEKWRCRRGEVRYLGSLNFLESPLRIYRTPLSWLLAGQEGICPLDLKRTLPLLLDYREIAAEDAAHGEQLDRRLKQARRPLPRIVVPSTGVAA